MLGKAEKKVLLCLLDNSRMSYSEIAKETWLSRQTVQRCIKSLKKKGVIRRFTVDVDPEKIGLDIMVYTMASFKRQTDYTKTERSLMYLREVSQVHHLLGRYDTLIEASVKDRRQLTALIKKIQGLSDIARTETFVVFETLKYAPEDPIRRILESSLN
ncbi:MAG: Lrp/AsnC family transcriptional regulator [Candidatus Diapherotrites archaeon]|nr:Lrp/AsnC family transcriptional regulator [Candidatus Diapherotrites archaeon]